MDRIEFPSPYGVSFILTFSSCFHTSQVSSVSVSLWSIIHSYLQQSAYHKYVCYQFPSPYGVSFILTLVLNMIGADIDERFRLLMEYHSFLQRNYGLC